VGAVTLAGIVDRVAVVTGAAQGIGAAVAAALAGDGATVAALDVNVTGAEETAAKLRAEGYTARAYACDVRNPTAVEAVVARVERELGPVGILVNVAGILRTGPVTESTDTDWHDVFDVNLFGVVHCSRAVARRMVPRRAGTIVTVGSNAGAVPRIGMAAYAASKAAAAQFTRCLGLELAAYGIRCNVVAPGSTDTAMQRSMWTSEADAATVVAGSLPLYKVGIPLGRLADPSDVAAAVVFLASDFARHVTLQELYVDGGAALR
jgi:2,3-dihydro-2,3-dihydroxybenzoate dehydrogenase